MEALKEVVTNVLDQQGVLARIKAELRANVFLALQDHGQKEKDTGFDQQSKNPCWLKLLETSEGQMLFSLVREFLECTGMSYTLKVFEPEANLQGKKSRKVLAEQLRLPTSELQKGMPLLYSIILNNQENMQDGSSLNQKQHNFHDSATALIPPKRATFDGQSDNFIVLQDEEDKKSGIQRKVSSGSTFSDSDFELETESQVDMTQQLNFEDDNITSDDIQKEESMFFVDNVRQDEEEDSNQNLFKVHRFNEFEEKPPGYGAAYSDTQLDEEIEKETNQFRQQGVMESDEQTLNNSSKQKEEDFQEIPVPKAPSKLGPLPSIGSKLGSLPPLLLSASRRKLEVSPQDLREELTQQGLISQSLNEDEGGESQNNDNSGNDESEQEEEDIEESIEEEDSNLSFGFETAEAVTPLGQLRTQEGNMFGNAEYNQGKLEFDDDQQE